MKKRRSRLDYILIATIVISVLFLIATLAETKDRKRMRYYTSYYQPSPIIEQKSNTSDRKKSGTGTEKSTKAPSSGRGYTGTGHYADDMPDCDDYDSWGDFMDDWDGKMPDGSDASDYWDNW